jgi:hypothetical protein
MAGVALGSSLRVSPEDLRATSKLHGIAVVGNLAKRSWWEPSGGARLFSPRSEADPNKRIRAIRVVADRR